MTLFSSLTLGAILSRHLFFDIFSLLLFSFPVLAIHKHPELNKLFWQLVTQKKSVTVSPETLRTATGSMLIIEEEQNNHFHQLKILWS
jgi:hypothetical protein